MTGVALAEELLLLAYDDESGKVTGSSIGLDLGMTAAVLIELTLAGRIGCFGGTIVVTDPTPTGYRIDDEVLTRMAAETPHTPSSWVQRLRHGLRGRVLADLVARGIVRDVGETALGFIRMHRYPVADPTVEREVRQRLTAVLTGQERPDERTAALAAVLAAARIEPRLDGPAPDAARQRLAEIAAAAGFGHPTDQPESDLPESDSPESDSAESSVRPSVAEVIAALTRAVDAALGARP